jgi:hypothetical protein
MLVQYSSFAREPRSSFPVRRNERWLNVTVKAKGGKFLAASQVPPAMTRQEFNADKVSPSMSGMGAVN